ncbi:ATP-dependent Clp protease proteolytic subunit, mitochondrial, partial [Trichonephila clavata]
GQATDILIQADEISYLKKRINSLYAKHTNQPLERIEQSMERDRYMNPEQAMEFGLIDKVLDRPPVTEDDKKSSS